MFTIFIVRLSEVETEIFIVNKPLEILISGSTAEILEIISFTTINTVQPDTECSNHSETNNVPEINDPIIKELLKEHSEIFNGIGKCKDKVITLHTKENAKPCIHPIRPIPFHLRKRFNSTVDQMIEGVFEEYNGPNEWISNPVIVPKDDKSIRITIDYRNVNKSVINSHCPIPRIDDLRASMNGSQYFTKLDLKQAFFQFPISDESKKLTTFYANGRLIRLCRHPQGVLSACSELNNALQQIFAQIPEVYAIHDDLLIATDTSEHHYAAIEKTFNLPKDTGLTLNGPKCIVLCLRTSLFILFYSLHFYDLHYIGSSSP